jgi:hypothetical protein
VTQADAQRVVDFVVAQPCTPAGRANIAWESSPQNPSGRAFLAAEIFAGVLGLWPPYATTDGAGDRLFMQPGTGSLLTE